MTALIRPVTTPLIAAKPCPCHRPRGLKPRDRLSALWPARVDASSAAVVQMLYPVAAKPTRKAGFAVTAVPCVAILTGCDMTQKPRARDLGLPFPGRTGPLNAITDVPGIRVGFTTLTDPGRKMRTGVTAILPRDDRHRPQPVWAGFHALNGNGEMTGVHWVNDAGYFLGPILITNTHGIGACHHGATEWMIRHYDTYFREEHAWAMPIVAETYDGTLNDINALHVKPEHAIAALDAATEGPVAEGSTGGGNGMIAYEFKGGTGTSSRRVEIGGTTYTVAALVQPLGVPTPKQPSGLNP